MAYGTPDHGLLTAVWVINNTSQSGTLLTSDLWDTWPRFTRCSALWSLFIFVSHECVYNGLNKVYAYIVIMNSTNNRLRKHKSSMCLQCRQWKFTHLFCSKCECVCLYLKFGWVYSAPNGFSSLLHHVFTVHMILHVYSAHVYSSLWTFSAGLAVHIMKVYSFLWTFSVSPVKRCDSCSCNNGLFCIWWQFLCSFPWILNL